MLRLVIFKELYGLKIIFFFCVHLLYYFHFKEELKMIPERETRAYYTNDFIRVYQAFNNGIANSALKYQKFISPPFKIQRTTWIKPSFLWMMYRSGWATKDHQERVLAIDITHEGFQWALNNSCLSHFDKDVYATVDEWEKIKTKASVVIQWDPERDIFLNQLNYRTIQIGLSPEASVLYIAQWIVKISDITETVKKIKLLIDAKKMAKAHELLPVEKHYPITISTSRTIGILGL
jgi:hypothetical protein